MYVVAIVLIYDIFLYNQHNLFSIVFIRYKILSNRTVSLLSI